ncbi:MAG: hypothetical protein K2K75_14605 [Muribaculaceae bacterium]|nr:hypothetical protein [Muribaculaceae bacterium]
MHNPYSGRQAPGFRFCFHVRAINHRSLFLPLTMKKLPKIQRLLQGESPLTVFECQSIDEARHAFRELRKKFDFAYWAATEYYIRDIKDADRIIPLQLNNIQHYLIDIMQKRYHNHQVGRYIITKSFGRVGLTTCIQAYMLWLQTYQCFNNSFTCSSNSINLNPLKTDLCRLLKRDIVPSEPWIYLPKADRRAFFNTFRTPDFIRGINLGYVHFADMSKWHDPDGDDASRVYASATSAVLMQYYTLIVLEGNIPKEDRFQMEKHQSFNVPWGIRLMRLTHLSKNPFFLDHVAMANAPTSYASPLFHINLDHTFNLSKKIRIPLLP